jgi:hypothetical protein
VLLINTIGRWVSRHMFCVCLVMRTENQTKAEQNNQVRYVSDCHPPGHSSVRNAKNMIASDRISQMTTGTGRLQRCNGRDDVQYISLPTRFHRLTSQYDIFYLTEKSCNQGDHEHRNPPCRCCRFHSDSNKHDVVL